MATKIIIARHGNTFTSDQTPTRVGARTDLPLVASGEEQAKRLGLHLKDKNLLPDVVYTSTLQRTMKTARLACDVMECSAPHTALPFLNEIDYGPDENKPEPEVRGRLGEMAIQRWDELGEMPHEWSPRPDVIKGSWDYFLTKCQADMANKTILIVTSNGIARFALNCADNGHAFPMKLSTGAYGILNHDEAWHVSGWNIKP